MLIYVAPHENWIDTIKGIRDTEEAKEKGYLFSTKIFILPKPLTEKSVSVIKNDNDSTVIFLPLTINVWGATKDLSAQKKVMVLPRDSKYPFIDDLLIEADTYHCFNLLADNYTSRALLYTILINQYTDATSTGELLSPTEMRDSYFSYQVRLRTVVERCADDFNPAEYISDDTIKRFSSLPI